MIIYIEDVYNLTYISQYIATVFRAMNSIFTLTISYELLRNSKVSGLSILDVKLINEPKQVLSDCVHHV